MRLLQRYIFFELLRLFVFIVSVLTLLLILVGLFREANRTWAWSRSNFPGAPLRRPQHVAVHHSGDTTAYRVRCVRQSRWRPGGGRDKGRRHQRHGVAKPGSAARSNPNHGFVHTHEPCDPLGIPQH